MPLDLIIDCGGTGDAYFTGGDVATYGFASAIDNSATPEFSKSNLDSVRFDPHAYNVPVAAGTYDVTLGYCEQLSGADDSTRSINVDVQGVRRLTNFSPFTAAGGRNKSIKYTYRIVLAASGNITIASSGSSVILNAFRIKQFVEPPADVTGLVATVVSATQINLDWDDVAGATYTVQVSVNSDFSSAVSSTSSVSNKSLTVLIAGTQYYLRVRSEKDGEHSNWTQISATTPETQSVLDEYFERFFLSDIFNITQLDLEMPVLRADFGDGYEAAALSGRASGLRFWTISADVLPDLSQYSVDYTVDGDDLTDSRFQYFWEFYRRHLSLGNKPFYFVDPRTNRKFLASFVDNRISLESITSKLYRGGVSIKQRRVKNSDLTYRTEDGSVSN